VRASAVAIRTRYRELAQIHHPDKWPPDSSEQMAAAQRMREINAAFDLIEDAPLQYRPLPVEPQSDPVFDTPRRVPRSRRDWLERIDLLICIRFLYGLSAGGALMYGLNTYGLMQSRLHFWLVSIAMGLVFARTSWLANRLLEAIIRFIR